MSFLCRMNCVVRAAGALLSEPHPHPTLHAMPGTPNPRSTSFYAFFFQLLSRRRAKVLFHGPEHPFNKDTAAGRDSKAFQQSRQGVRAAPVLFHSWPCSPPPSPRRSQGVPVGGRMHTVLLGADSSPALGHRGEVAGLSLPQPEPNPSLLRPGQGDRSVPWGLRSPGLQQRPSWPAPWDTAGTQLVAWAPMHCGPA